MYVENEVFPIFFDRKQGVLCNLDKLQKCGVKWLYILTF